jgi:hypothetical protein
MTDREPAEVTNLDRYGNPELPWSRARRRNATARAAPLMRPWRRKAPASP